MEKVISIVIELTNGNHLCYEASCFGTTSDKECVTISKDGMEFMFFHIARSEKGKDASIRATFEEGRTTMYVPVQSIVKMYSRMSGRMPSRKRASNDR